MDDDCLKKTNNADEVSTEMYKQLLAELEETKRKLAYYEALVDAIPIPTFAKTDDAKFCIVNKAYEEYFDVKKESMLETSVLNVEHLSEADRKRYHHEDMQAIKNITEVQYDTTFFGEQNTTQAMYWSKGFISPTTQERGLVGIFVDISKQKAFEASLNIANERMKLMLDHMPLAAQIWSEQHELVDASQRGAALLGYDTAEEFIANFDNTHPEFQPDGQKSIELVHTLIDEAFETGFLKKTWLHKSSSNEPIPFEITFVRTTLNNKKVLLLFLKDLREHYSHLDAMREADEYNKVMLDASPLGTAIWDKNLNLINCNAAMANTYKLAKGEDFLTDFHKLYPEYQPDGSHSTTSVKEHLQRALTEGSSYCKWVGLSASGQEFPMEVSLVRVKNRGEHMVVAFLKDLSEIEINAKKIRATEQRTSAILDAVPLGINIFNNDIELIDCNTAALHLSKLSSKAEYIEKIMSFFPEYQLNGQNSAEFMKEKFDLAAQNGHTRFEMVSTHFNGDELPMDVTLVYTHLEQEDLYIAYVNDLTKDKKMLHELELAKNSAEKSAMAKSEFLANMSHEIRTPMNGILGLLHILSGTELNDAQQSYMQKALFSTNELLRIINDILDFSKIEAGKLEMELIAFSLHHVCSELESLFGHAVQDKGLEFQLIEGDYSTVQLLGDPLRLKQIIFNLVSNAIKFTGKGKVGLEIKSTLQGEDLHCQFIISDTGIGLTKDQINNLFSAFSQADTSVTRKYGGTGLGLAISKNIVEMMQGKIWVESTPGIGSNFYFTSIFKLAKKDRQQVENKKYNIEDKRYSGHLLLVEDNQINQIIAEELLKTVGYTLEIANNGQEAIEMLEKGNYDLVLMDIQMPIMDGLTASQKIRANEKFAKLPIVAMSAHAMTGDKEKSLQSGMNDHITKPISPAILYNTLAYWLKKD